MSSPAAPRFDLSRRRFLERLALGGAAVLAGRLVPAARGADARDLLASRQGRKLGVALVGLGRYAGGQLAPALQETGLCRLAGVVTGSHAKGVQWAREYGFPGQAIYGYDTMDRIADNPDIDIVYVVTPPGLHARHAIAAAKAGKHVISEKPMATSVADCDAMIAACRAAGVKLSIGYRLHFEPHHGELERLARSGEFGAFERMDGGFGFHLSEREWRIDKQLAGGGPLPDVGTYVIQEACRARREEAPVAVTAREGRKERPELFHEVEEEISWTMEFAGGAVGAGFASYARGANRFRAEAPRGWVELAPAFSYRGIAGETSRGPMRLPRVNQQAAQMDDFAACVLTGRATPVPGEMGRRDIAIITAIYEAAATGKRVAVRI